MNSRRFIRSSSQLKETGAEYQVSMVVALRRATRLRGMSAMPSIAPELMRWDELTRWAKCGLPHRSMLSSITKSARSRNDSGIVNPSDASAGFEVDDKPEARRLFDRDIGGA
jgi:hypothetical protein